MATPSDLSTTETTSILIVEDEPIIALDIKYRLVRLGYHVVDMVDCAADAIAAVINHEPNLVLMDIRLRGPVSGIEAAATIQSKSHIPVIYLTAHADPATLQHAKATQPFGYVVKPFENHDLVTAIEIALSRHHVEVVTQQALERERELSHLKSQFISVVSHEFRTPLGVILMSIDLIEQFFRPTTASKPAVWLSRARSAIHQLKQLIEEVLVLGAAGSGKLKFQPQPVDLSAFCQTFVEEWQLIATPHHPIHWIEISRDSDMAWRSVDLNLLRHILSNLLSNAIKYSPDGSSITVEMVKMEKAIVFHISDSGIGIPPSDQAHLFDMFYRASNVGTTPGTGLGLSVVQQCVDLHGGQVHFKSSPQTGTRFSVTIPTGVSNEARG